jgi:cobalt-zinc-cadmium efflux system membrane fusion protein
VKAAGLAFALLCQISCLSSCARGQAQSESAALPSTIVDEEGDGGLVRVEHPDRFRLVRADERRAAPELSVTGVVSPDVSRAVPVVSLASGRIVDLRVRLGDTVRKGQLLLRIQSADVASAFADYRKAVADESLAGAQLNRAQALFDRGAIAKKDLEVAQDAESKAGIDVQTAAERMRLLGVATDQAPTGVVDITAPSDGVISEQNVATAAGVKSLDNSPNLLVISDLSHVWILCDVYENDLALVRVGDAAEIRLAAYPDRVLKGRIGNIGPILDPNLRTAKVRVEVANAGEMRLGMFVTATFHGRSADVYAVVPATAVLHLHDRDWVFVPAGVEGMFVRQEVRGGPLLPDRQQEIRSGLRPGEQVVSDALLLQNSAPQ